MTNIEIIISRSLTQGIFTEDPIAGFLSEDCDIPLKTYKSCQEAGFNVGRGQKAESKVRNKTLS